MKDVHDEMENAGPNGSRFPTTNWTMFAESVVSDPDRSLVMLERLCGSYWKPVYAYIRCRGYSPQDSEDLTQGFFARILTSARFEKMDPKKGTFRSFLLASCTNFLISDWKRQSASKRGGGAMPLALDGMTEAEFRKLEPVDDDLLADVQFDRQWALAVIATAMESLRSEHASRGKEAVFDCLSPHLLESEDGYLKQAAATLGVNEVNVKTILFRMRRRLGQLLRSEVARTVRGPDEIEDELRHLITVASRRN